MADKIVKEIVVQMPVLHVYSRDSKKPVVSKVCATIWDEIEKKYIFNSSHKVAEDYLKKDDKPSPA